MSIESVARHYHLPGRQLQEQYKEHWSDFRQWDQLSHADDWVLFPGNIGPRLSIDETDAGDLRTIISNKAARGRKGSIVAIVKGTRSEDVSAVLLKMPRRVRYTVKEITLDMAPNMEKIARECFPAARLVTDRFHVHQLVHEAVQDIRVQHRWEAIEQENEAIIMAKESGCKYKPTILENGDTLKQLLARSRYLLYKKPSTWKPSQETRAGILFGLYPDIKKAYYLALQLGQIFQQTRWKDVAYTKLAQWYRKVEETKFKAFATVAKTIENHYQTILNYFDNRATNAAAESFNAKIKDFRRSFRGIRDTKFFLFRLCKIYA